MEENKRVILTDIGTCSMGNGFFVNNNNLYFFSPEELKKIQEDSLDKLTKLMKGI